MMKDDSNVVCARVTDAPALGGTKMYQVKISCKGKSKSMYKTKDDFKNVINMFKLVGAMAARKSDGDRCEVCASCSSMTTEVRVCDEDGLDAFLGSVLDRLRKAPREAIDECSSHKGVIQILMDFLGISKGKYFCHEQDEADPTAADGESCGQDNDLDHPIAHCSLHRSISEQFAAMDSVC